MSKNKIPKIVSNTWKKVGKLVQHYQMLSPNDHVLVGLSGGKDSLILLEALADRQKHIPFPFKITAAHITSSTIGYKTNQSFISNFCKDLQIPLVVREAQIEHFDPERKRPCFVCSWMRRKSLFDLTRELNCNKLALGHHMDDALETMLMNMIYHGSLSSLPQKFTMFNGRVELIRPLLNLPESLLQEYALARNFPAQDKECPYGNDTSRKQMKEMLKNIQSLYDKAKINMFRAMDNAYPEYLPVKDIR